MLYFTNSIGAAIGVLISGFLLVNLLGQPGTIRSAGVIKIVLAVTAWVLSSGLTQKSIQLQEAVSPLIRQAQASLPTSARCPDDWNRLIYL